MKNKNFRKINIELIFKMDDEEISNKKISYSVNKSLIKPKTMVSIIYSSIETNYQKWIKKAEEESPDKNYEIITRVTKGR